MNLWTYYVISLMKNTYLILLVKVVGFDTFKSFSVFRPWESSSNLWLPVLMRVLEPQEI
jgi:hypothetical protein